MTPPEPLPNPGGFVRRERESEHADVAARAGRQVEVGVDGGGVVHPQRREDPLVQVVGEGPPADHLDQAGGDLEVGVVVLPPGAGFGGQTRVAQVLDGLAQGEGAPAPAVGGELGVGHAGGLVEQLADGDPRRAGVGHRELGQVLPHRVVQAELSRLDQLEDRQRGEGLAHRGHGHGCALGDGLPAGGGAVPLRVDDLRAVGQDHRRAGKAGGLPVLLHEGVDRGGGRGPQGFGGGGGRVQEQQRGGSQDAEDAVSAAWPRVWNPSREWIWAGTGVWVGSHAATLGRAAGRPPWCGPRNRPGVPATAALRCAPPRGPVPGPGTRPAGPAAGRTLRR
ncbi:hypothetical protein SUDANB67_03453 [Nocardiopsis dassonvillei]